MAPDSTTVTGVPPPAGASSTIAARPATVRAYAKGKAVNTTPTITEESKKLLFGQGADRIAA